jgi:stage IV sporulation protein FB
MHPRTLDKWQKKLNIKFLNVPIYIHPTFWIFLLFFTDIYRDPSIEIVIWGVVMFFSLLVHEYGHALTARYFGAEPTITLEAFGGNARYNGRGISPKQEFLITLNGPLFESVLILISYILLKLEVFEAYPYINYFFYVTMRLNILWCLLNLIPLVPLDGGHLVRYVLEKKFGSQGKKISILIGLLCVALAIPYLYFSGFFFFGILLVIYSIQNLQALRGNQSFSRKKSSFSSYLEGVEAVNANELAKATMIFKKLLNSKDMQIYHSAAELLAKIYFQKNEHQKAYHLLLQADHNMLKEGKCLLCKLAYEHKNYELVCKYSREIYEIDPSYEIALLNSKAHAGMQQPLLAGAWLVTASQFGDDFKDQTRKAMSESIYDLIKEQGAFKLQIEKLEALSQLDS